MYSYIKGTLEETDNDTIVVENNGIGYNISVSGRVLDELPDIGESVKIYTYLHVKEDCFALYGFLTRDDLMLFRMMLNVNGIGPKGALGILTVLSGDDLRAAVVSDDAKAIAKAPGVGAKTAQKLIIELKDKVHLEDILETEREGEKYPVGALSAVKQEAVQALVSLGYSQNEARNAVASVNVAEGMDIEEILKASLKNIAFL